MPAPRLYTTAEACRMLFRDRTTFKRWREALNIVPTRDPADDRIAGYTHAQLKHIADVHHIRLGELPLEPEPSRRMRELERRVEVLEAAVALLEAHHPQVRGELGQPHPARQNRSTARHTGKFPQLPERAISFRQLVVVEYGVDERTAVKWVNGGELPEPTRGGQWYDPQTKGVASRIYTAEQIPAARAALARLTGQATGEQ